MSFHKNWNTLYESGRHNSVWPWTDVIVKVKRHVKPSPGNKVLELGTGPGANIPFFLDMGIDYFGIEGSASAVDQILERFPDLAGNLVVGDFTKELPFNYQFDFIVDRGSLTHNDAAGIRSALALVDKCLKPGGMIVGVDWFSTEFSDMKLGEPTDDPHVWRDFKSGLIKGTGLAHFSDRVRLEELLKDFELIALEHKRLDTFLPVNSSRYASWNFVAVKPTS
jgi:hypothetical protein